MKRAVLVATLVVVALVAFGAWWYLIRDDTPPEAALVDREVTDTGSTPDGEWVVATGDETFTGFRITEHFPGVDNTAVVRTPAVEGTLVVDGTTITEATVAADLTALESQDSVPPGIPGIENRVDQLRGDGLETDTFPTATFVLAEPIELDDVPAVGETLTVDAVGDLTVHGETRRVTIPLEARWSGEVIDVAGSLEVALAGHGMTPPERAFVSVDDRGTMELQLSFERSAAS